MDDAKLLQIEPSELTFNFELKKQISCSLHLANKTTNHVAFKVKTTNAKKYCVKPNISIITPQGTCDVTIYMQAQSTVPVDFECKEKFLIQSTVVPFYTSLDDISSDLFAKDSGAGKRVEEKKLRVVLVPLNGDLNQEENPSNPIHATHPNDASQLLSMAKDIEKLKKDVEELKSKLSVMDVKPTEGFIGINKEEQKN